MKWADHPTEDGFYWLRAENAIPQPVRLISEPMGRCIYFLSCTAKDHAWLNPTSTFGGEERWYGPIHAPEDTP